VFGSAVRYIAYCSVTEASTTTTTLKEAFDKAAALPPDRQDAIAAIMLEEMAVEDRWQKSFARSQDALSKLAANALDEDAQERTLDIDEA
jgi:hypothetical protein